MHPKYIPFVNPTTIAPPDNLHLFADGLLRSECAWLFYVLIKLGLNLDDANKQLRAFKGFTRGVRVPPFHPNLKEGAVGGKPSSDKTMRMTGSQMMEFTKHSIAVLSPILTPQMRAHPAWRSWTKLVELFTLTIKHSLTLAEIERIDDLQLEHSKCFDEVWEYKGLKRPKHHFLVHMAHDIWRYGPPREYWCFGFEGFNRLIKQGARRSNYRDTTMSIMRYWSLWSASDELYSKY